MKKCSHCGRAYSDFVTTCTYCGAPLDGGNAQPQDPRYSAVPQQPVPPQQTYSQPTYSQPVNPQPTYAEPVYTQPQYQENVLMGIIGAVLFSIGGIILQVIISSLGYLAAIVGIAMFYLAQLGYQKFSKCGPQISKVGKIICIVVSVVMLMFAVTFGTAVQIVSALKAEGMYLRISEAIQLIREIPELFDAFCQDLATTFGLWGFSVVISLFMKKKNKA